VSGALFLSRSRCHKLVHHGDINAERKQGIFGKRRINAVKEDCRQWSLNIRRAVDRTQDCTAQRSL